MSMTSLPNIKPAVEQERGALVEKVKSLTQKSDRKWEVVLEGKGLRREFRFKGFVKCWDFMNAVAEQCKAAKHHPEWWNAYNRTVVTWTTHNPEGLTTKDVEMAEFCDEQARQFNEVGEGVEVAGCAGPTKGKAEQSA